MLKLLNRTELLLGIYIALYVAIPANGIDAIFGFNIQVIFLGLTLLSYLSKPLRLNIFDRLTGKYVGVQLLFAFFFVLSSTLFSNVNYYGTFMNFAQFSVLMFLMGQVINEYNFRYFLQFFVFGCMFNSILALGGGYIGIQTIIFIGTEENRLQVIGRDSNELAMIHNISTVIALFFIREKERSITNILAIVLTLLIVLTTGSRTGLVTCIALIIINFIISSSGLKQRMLLLLGSGILLVGIYYYAIYYMDDSLLERYMNIGEELEEGTMANRTIIWSYIIRAFENSSPIEQVLGHGWNTTPLFTFNGYDAHNVFLKMAIEFGIIGVIIVILYLLFFFKNAFIRRTSSYGFLIGGVIFCVTISFMTLSWIYNIIIWIVFLLMHKVIQYTK